MSQFSKFFGIDALCAAIDRHGEKIVEAAKIEARWTTPELPPAPEPTLAPPWQTEFDAWNVTTAKTQIELHHRAGLFQIAIGRQEPRDGWTRATAVHELVEMGAPLP